MLLAIKYTLMMPAADRQQFARIVESGPEPRGIIGGVALDERHHHNAGFKTRKPKRQFRENSNSDRRSSSMDCRNLDKKRLSSRDILAGGKNLI